LRLNEDSLLAIRLKEIMSLPARRAGHEALGGW
jgi:hypothetical protein